MHLNCFGGNFGPSGGKSSIAPVLLYSTVMLTLQIYYRLNEHNPYNFMMMITGMLYKCGRYIADICSIQIAIIFALINFHS